MDEPVRPGSGELEMSGEALREAVGRAMERIAGHLDSLASQPAARTDRGEELARSLREEPPERGTPLDDLLDLIFDRVVPESFNTAGPGYLAYIPGGGLPQSAVADLIADSVNRYVGVWAAAPGLAQIEANVIGWFCRIVGYPRGAGGFLTSGGSLANFSAVFTARRERLPEDFLRGTLYASDQAHHSIAKAALLAGFPRENVRLLPSDERFRLRIDALAEAVATDRRTGFQPFFVVGNGGTTNSGAVDDLDALADFCAEESLWLHVDAAYGGFFALTEEGRAALKGLGRSDSAVLDPHKSLFLPYGTGSLLVRDLETLARAHAATAAYMPPMRQDREFVDFCQISPELSRDWRALRVWLPLKLHGLSAFRRDLQEKLDLAKWAAARLAEIPGIEIAAPPQLSLLAFRWRLAGMSAEESDRVNRQIVSRVNARGRVHITGTELHGLFAIRFCILSFRTHRDRVAAAIEDVADAVQAIRTTTA